MRFKFHSMHPGILQMKNRRIIVVEDEAGVRKGLSNWLSNEYEIVNFESAEDFLRALKAFDFEDGKPTAMLLDFQMPGMNGVELQTTLHQMNLEFPIIFMSGNAEKEDVIEAWHGGAVDFILKPFSPQKISKALETLFQKIEISLTKNELTKQINSPIDLPITSREADVLLLLGRGHRQNEVAQILGISLRSVKMYRGYIKDKLGLNTPVELIRFFDKNESSIKQLSKLK